jgi:hypothetical protein
MQKAVQSMTATDTTRRQDLQHFRAVMMVLAFGTVVAGFLLRIGHDWLQLSAEEARDLATLFLVVGVADTLVLYNWDRLFGRR